MKILSYNNNSLSKETYLYKALNIDLKNKQVISFVGGGGKTTSIYTLANELINLNKKVIITTTTHMHMPKDCVIFNGNITELKIILDIKKVITLGVKADNNKISSIGEEVSSTLIEHCDFLLIEADGAKMLPLKAPASYEPVLLKNTTLIVGIAGIDSAFKSINEICHRPQIVANILDTNLNHIITPKDIAYILSNKNGQMKGVKYNLIKNYRVIINKADTNSDLNNAIEVASHLSIKGIDCAITSYI